MPKSRKPAPRSIEAQAQQEIDAELDELVAAIAAEEGLASDAAAVSNDKEVELWGQRDPRVDYDALRQQLMTGTVPQEMYDPTSDARLALVKLLPAYADLFAQVTPESPLDGEMAAVVADLAEYPFRLSVLGPLEDDPQAMVERAERINARWQRRMSAAAVPEGRGNDGRYPG